MENQNSAAPKKSARWKFVLGLLGIIFLVLAVLIGGKVYFFWQGAKAVQELAEAMKRVEEESYQRAMADSYGGRTPQETLQMYIDAVEKSDYELASKYFIGDYQERELRSFENSKQENIENLIKILKTVRPYTKEEEEEILKRNYKSFLDNFPSSMHISYEEYIKNFEKSDQNRAIMFTKVDGYDFSIRFKKYPNGTWKIIEI